MVVTTASPFPVGLAGNSLVVSNDPDFANHLRGILEKDCRHEVELAASCEEAEAVLARRIPEAVFVDLRKSAAWEDPAGLLDRLNRKTRRRAPVVAVSDDGYVCDWAAMADLITSGHLQLPVDRKQLFNLLEFELAGNLFQHNPGLSEPCVVQSRSVAFKTYTPAMAELFDNLKMVASHDVTLLLVGETGTGKTTMARMIHELSGRRESRMLTVSCGAIPNELIESELFGHVKGSFTSADRSKIGKFEAAGAGSLLLDEIDVLDRARQAKLLRVIETGEFEPVGSNETRVSKARLIVASNVDLKQLVEQNEFRADLFYRLNVLEFRLLPLRERPGDIVPLALDFVEEFCRVHKVEIRRVHPDFLACLKNYSWPGNVRELKNHIRRAVLFCQTGQLTPENLAPHFLESMKEAAPPEVPPAATLQEGAGLLEMVAASERALLEQALRRNNNNRTATARALKLSRVGLYKKMKKYGMIDSPATEKK